MSSTRQKDKLRLRQRESPCTDTAVPASDRMLVTISWTALFKIVAVGALVFLCVLVGRLGALIFLALLLSVALSRLVHAVRSRGGPKWLGVTGAALIVLAAVTALAGFLLPAIATQLN